MKPNTLSIVRALLLRNVWDWENFVNMCEVQPEKGLAREMLKMAQDAFDDFEKNNPSVD